MLFTKFCNVANLHPEETSPTEAPNELTEVSLSVFSREMVVLHLLHPYRLQQPFYAKNLHFVIRLKILKHDLFVCTSCLHRDS